MAQRNGHRPRLLAAPAADVELGIANSAKPRSSPACWSGAAASTGPSTRRRWTRGCMAGALARSTTWSKALAAGISKSEVSRICAGVGPRPRSVPKPRPRPRRVPLRVRRRHLRQCPRQRQWRGPRRRDGRRRDRHRRPRSTGRRGRRQRRRRLLDPFFRACAPEGCRECRRRRTSRGRRRPQWHREAVGRGRRDAGSSSTPPGAA